MEKTEEVGKTTDSERVEETKAAIQKTEQVDVQAQSENNEPRNATVDEYDQPGLLVGAAKRRAIKEAEGLAKSQKPAPVAQESKNEIAKRKDTVKGRFIVEYGYLKPVLQTLNRFEGEAKFGIDSNGLHTRVMDPAHVAMIDVTMSRGEFLEWYFDEDAEYALDVERIIDLKLNPKDTVTFEWNNKKEGTYTVSNGVSSMTLPLLDPDTVKVPKIPDIKANDYFVINAGYLKDFFGNAKNVSDAFRITMDPIVRSIILKAASESTEAKTEIANDMMKEFRIYGPDIVSAIYPQEYFINFLKDIKKDEELKIEMKSDYPATVRYAGNQGLTNIIFLLAPRAE
jgi:proliferating cell nuclear antigen